MIINYDARGKDAWVEYTPFTKVPMEDESVFMYQNIKEEIMSAKGMQKLKKIKQAKKIIKMSLSILGASASLTTRTFASGVTGNTPLLNPLNPGVMVEYGLQIAFIAVGVAVALSIVLLVIAGTLRMFRKSHEANVWTQDIIKGITQVLISVPSIYIIYRVASYLFRNLNFLSLGF